MGILKLMDFVKTKFPKAVTQTHLQHYSGKTIAIDASNWIYQLLIKSLTMNANNKVSGPTDESGNQTGHLIGIMARVAFCLQGNVMPVWVFDGVAPKEKGIQLRRRRELKQLALVKMEEARDDEQSFDLLKMSQRSVKITQIEKEDAKTLLKLIGVPVIQSPSEAEPQCAQIVKSQCAYGTSTEDMDTLAFGCPILIRGGLGKDKESYEISLDKLLKESQITYQKFVDLCILCGCDYSSKIRNIGPVKAYSFIKKYGTIQNILQAIASEQKLSKKHTFDDDFNYLAARKIFTNPNVMKVTPKDIAMGEFKQQQLVHFLKRKQFNEGRINNWLMRMKKTNFQSDLFKL